jgi:hypothetical protein
LEGELSEKKKQRVDKHLENCQTCRKIFEKTRQAWVSAASDKIDYQPFFYTRVKQRMEDREESKRTGFFPQISRKLLQPAIYFAVLGLGIYLGIQLGKGLEPGYDNTAQTRQIDYIENYANSQFLNGMELEIIEQEMLTDNKTENENNDE